MMQKDGICAAAQSNESIAAQWPQTDPVYARICGGVHTCDDGIAGFRWLHRESGGHLLEHPARGLVDLRHCAPCGSTSRMRTQLLHWRLLQHHKKSATFVSDEDRKHYRRLDVCGFQTQLALMSVR
jgi:hypothetical protein